MSASSYLSLTGIFGGSTPGASGEGGVPRVLSSSLIAASVASGVLLYIYKGWISHSLYKAIAKSRTAKAGKAYLSGNFAPVRAEQFVQALHVEQGAIPEKLQGVYVRNGPNPMLQPVAGYHWFDGDGMLHAVRLKGGKASYCNHAVRTSKLAQEQAYKEPLFGKMGDMTGKLGLLLLLLDKLRQSFGFVSTSKGTGTANTALTFHAKRLLALHEGDLPYAVRVLCSGVLDTIGRLSLTGPKDQWQSRAFTAHPKLDAKTGELAFFSYDFESKPYVRAGLLDQAGELKRTWDVDVPYPAMMHDMAATKSYIVLLHMPLAFDPKVMTQSDSLPLVFNPQLKARIGLLRRDSASSSPGSSAEVQWFELPAFYTFHVANAFEDTDGTVKIYACHFKEFHFGGLDEERDLPEEQQQRMYEYRLNPADGSATLRKISDVVGDFPVVHPALACHKTRYTWVARLGKAPGNPVAFSGISKIDLAAPPSKDACVATINFPSGCFGGEASFVPLHQNPKDGQEDAGWLLVYVYHSAEGSSKLHIYDAMSMNQQPVAVVRMPTRVPYGFHGMFVTEEQLASQSQRD